MLVSIEMPWGETRQVNDYAAPAVYSEIARQASFPLSARDYGPLFAMLDADSGVAGPTFSGLPTGLVGGRYLPGKVPETLPRYGNPVVASTVPGSIPAQPVGLDAFSRLFGRKE